MMPKPASSEMRVLSVEMKTGVTKRICPEAAAAVLDAETGPCRKPISVAVPTLASPVVQGAPETVKMGKPPFDLAPPTPTTLRGTDIFAGGDPLQRAKKHTFAVPMSGILPARDARAG